MRNLNHLPDEKLITEIKTLVREELRIGLEVLEHLREVERRKLYLERGHSSLFAFCTRELEYSEPQASLRIDAMRALRDTPEIEDKIRSGELNVTSVVKVQRFLRRESRTYDSEARQELFVKMAGKSVREVDEALVAISPVSALPQERVRAITEDRSELRLVIPESLRLQLEELRAVHSHRLKNPSSTVELLEILAADALKRVGQLKRDATPDQNIAPISIQVNVNSRHVPAPVRRAVMKRDHRKCTYKDPVTGRECGSRYYLQLDHVVPFSLGGHTTVGNLRVLCGQHNRLAWRKMAGE